MVSIAESLVTIQTFAQSVPSTPTLVRWSDPDRLLSQMSGVLAAIEERVHFVRRRFGHYNTIDFVAV